MKFSIRRINEWLVVLAVVIILPFSFNYAQHELNLLSNDFLHFFNIRPTTYTMNINALDAISMFRGEEPKGFSIDKYTASMYFSMVLYLMIGPFLLYKGFKKSKDHENKAKPWYWYLGGAICLGALALVPVEMKRLSVSQDTKESAAISRQKDMLRAELVKIGFATAQHEILEDGVDKNFSIDKLGMDHLKYSYAIEENVSDTLIVIAASNPDIPDHQLNMEIRPYSERVLRIRN